MDNNQLAFEPGAQVYKYKAHILKYVQGFSILTIHVLSSPSKNTLIGLS